MMKENTSQVFLHNQALENIKIVINDIDGFMVAYAH